MHEFLEGSVNLTSLLLYFNVFLAFTLALFLFFVKSAKNKSNVFLGFIIFVFFLQMLAPFVHALRLLETFPHVVKLYTVFTFTIGPTAYFYVKSCTQKDFKMTPQKWLHYLPAVLDLLYHIPFFISSGDEKLQYFYDFFIKGSNGEPVILVIIKAIYSLAYGFISLKVVLFYKNNLSNEASNIDPAFHRWLLFFCPILLVPIIAIIIVLFSNAPTYGATFIFFCIFLFLSTVYANALLKPAIFHKFPHRILAETQEQSNQKYERSNLKEEQKDKYVKKLIHYVEEHRPYMESELTLTDLSAQTKIPAHYLSQVINEKLDCNFLDFINTYRIKEAKEKLVDSAFSHYTIIAIAYEVGFNSKTAFYSSFKKNTGTTPSNFRKSLKAS